MKSRLHKVISKFNRGSKISKLNQLMFRSGKTVKVNDNGTSGLLLKDGKNSGKILGHIKLESKKL
jgi:hypothetical protein